MDAAPATGADRSPLTSGSADPHPAAPTSAAPTSATADPAAHAESGDDVDPLGGDHGDPLEGDVIPTHHHRPESAARRARRRRRAVKRLRRRIRAGLMITAGVLLLAAAWVGLRTYQAYGHLEDVAAQVGELREQLVDGDRVALASSLADLRESTTAASGATSDPLYRVATVLPWVGDDLDAIAVIADTSRDLATEILPVVVDIAEVLRPADLAPRSGVIDLAPITSLTGSLATTADRVDVSRAAVAALDRASLAQPIRNAAVQLWSELDQLSGLSRTAVRLSEVLPPMLGDEGPRTYLLVFQNTAELRATGGLFGSYAVITADRGAVSIGDTGSVSRQIGVFDPPIDTLTADQRALYTDRMASYAVDVNLSPDFPTAASLISAMYTERTGDAIDGVIAVDPTSLSYLLAGTGPVTVDGIELSSATVVKKLLADVYRKFEDDQNAVDRDEFLGSVTGEVFRTVMNGGGDPTKMFDALVRSVQERRVLIWSADSAEQAIIEEADMAGRLPDQDGTNPIFGVYLNDGTGAKLGYYLSSAVEVTPGTCRADGRREWSVTVDLDYRAPADGLPEYVLGLGLPGEKYVLRTNVMLVAPSAGGILAVDRDGDPAGMQAGNERGRSVGVVTVDLAPADSTELTFLAYTDPVVGPAATGDLTPQVRMTPGKDAVETRATAAAICDPVR